MFARKFDNICSLPTWPPDMPQRFGFYRALLQHIEQFRNRSHYHIAKVPHQFSLRRSLSQIHDGQFSLSRTPSNLQCGRDSRRADSYACIRPLKCFAISGIALDGSFIGGQEIANFLGGFEFGPIRINVTPIRAELLLVGICAEIED